MAPLLLCLLVVLAMAQNASTTTPASTTAAPATTTAVDPNATTTTTTAAATTTTASASTTPAILLPPGCVLRPQIAGGVYQVIEVTAERDFMTTNCAVFMSDLARDMRLAGTAQLFLTGARPGSFVASVSVADPNGVGIVQQYVGNVRSGNVDMPGLSCVVYNGSTSCLPAVPLFVIFGLVSVGVIVVFIVILIVLAIRKKRKQESSPVYTEQRETLMTDYDPLVPKPGQKHMSPAPSTSPSPSVTVIRASGGAADASRHVMLYSVQDKGASILQAKAGDVVVIQPDDWESRGEWVWGSLLNGSAGWLPSQYIR